MELTKKGLGVTIGDGRHTEFWNHIWLDSCALRDRTREPLPMEQQKHKVRDYWHPEMGWDWATLSQFLPINILQRLVSAELTDEVVGDLPVWKASKTGNFSIKSAIQLVQEMEEDDTETWTKLWKIRTPHRVRFFIWLLLHGRLMTNVERVM